MSSIENDTLFERLMGIHSNPPIYYMALTLGAGRVWGSSEWT